MYISINREALTVHHKHPVHGVVTGLASIELSHVKASVIPVESCGFVTFTDMEVRMLHKNVSGKKMEAVPFHRLVQELIDILLELPDTDANPSEVSYQVRQISLLDKGSYKYVKGSYIPGKLQDLFEPEPITTQTPKRVVVPSVVTPIATTTTPQAASQFTQPLPTWHPLYKAQQTAKN